MKRIRRAGSQPKSPFLYFWKDVSSSNAPEDGAFYRISMPASIWALFLQTNELYFWINRMHNTANKLSFALLTPCDMRCRMYKNFWTRHSFLRVKNLMITYQFYFKIHEKYWEILTVWTLFSQFIFLGQYYEPGNLNLTVDWQYFNKAHNYVPSI